jgi:hypothetical protein
MDEMFSDAAGDVPDDASKEALDEYMKCRDEIFEQAYDAWLAWAKDREVDRAGKCDLWIKAEDHPTGLKHV